MPWSGASNLRPHLPSNSVARLTLSSLSIIVLGPVLPIGRKMTSPRSLSITDLDGTKHECVAEAFDTKWNVLILLYPVTALTATTIILPRGFKKKISDRGRARQELDRALGLSWDRNEMVGAIIRTPIGF